MDSPRTASPSPAFPTEAIAIDECPRFRILIVGQAGSGKSSLIDAVFKTSLRDDVIHGQAGTIDINQEIASPQNKHLIVHYHNHRGQEGVESLKKFLAAENRRKHVAITKPHVVWLCVTPPSLDDSEFILDEKRPNPSRYKADIAQYLLQIKTTVPTIVVFTKIDIFLSEPGEFYERRCQALTKGHLPYTLVSIWQPETLQRLVQITMQTIGLGAQSPPNRFIRLNNRRPSENDQQAGSSQDILSLAQIGLAAAQHVDMQTKAAASIKIGEKQLRTIARLSDLTLENCVGAVHSAIVAVWNIQDLDEFLLSDSFRRRMISVVRDLYNRNQSSNATQAEHNGETIAWGAGDTWIGVIYQGGPEHLHCSMAYTVDLILMLQAVYRISLEGQFQATPDRVNEIIYEFVCSEKQKSIHDAIAAFVANQRLASDDIGSQIESLVKENEITKDGMQFDQTRPPLLSLLAILKTELSTRNIVNRITLNLMYRLLDSPNHLMIASELETDSDVELLLDFVLCLLRDGSLEDSVIQGAKRETRRLMNKLSRRQVLPRTLFIHNVKTDLDTIGEGGFGKVFRGENEGRPVALKVLYKSLHPGDSLRKDFCREALAWWSLSHRFILPLLGIYEETSRIFLVSPFMTNGTLLQWRKNRRPGVAEIYRVMAEVAQGVHYIHSEGIVHGDLSERNILLDSQSRCKITDFGLSRHVEATITGNVSAHAIHYTAPELFGMCMKCLELNCVGCNEDKVTKTMEADVYAVGCLYYTAFFGVVPHEGHSLVQVMWRVASSTYPDRLDNPRMSDSIWDLINHCWTRDPSKRPTMRQIVDAEAQAQPLLQKVYVDAEAQAQPLLQKVYVDAEAQAQPDAQSKSNTSPHLSLLTILRKKKVYSELQRIVQLNIDKPGSAIGCVLNVATIDLARSLLVMKNYVNAVLQLTDTSDTELLLDFMLHLLCCGHLSCPEVPDADRRARRLMLKMIKKTLVMPSSLFVKGINAKVDYDSDYIGHGGFGLVFKGEKEGNSVALKLLHKTRHNDDFCREALMWRSLNHERVLPFLGIFENGSRMFLVSPYMKNGNLSQWRKKEVDPSTSEIQRLILEVAEGIQYIHSEGIVHGDLRGDNVLLDAHFHVQITDFGLTRHSDATATHSGALHYNFAAPELLGNWDEEAEDSESDDDGQLTTRTQKSDVYAFGCLYYEIQFDIIPFQGMNELQIMKLISRGKRPPRMNKPSLSDKTWKLIKRCWAKEVVRRPAIEDIVEKMMAM